MHLSETGIVQDFDQDGKADVFRCALMIWLADASSTELDVLCAELLDGFDGSKD
jgi:hypothetical protein